jgi:RNA 3'-terminal phosphate cyclase (ATP)
MLWNSFAGFQALGEKGLPAERVAEKAVSELLQFEQQSSAVDRFLADQLLLPLALAKGESSYTCDVLTSHTLSGAALIRLWLDAKIDLDGDYSGPGSVSIAGIGHNRS